jgi:hypothetical protein
MIAVLVWLHKASNNGDLTEAKFLKCGFAFGETFENEISDAINRKKRASGQQQKTTNKKIVPADQSVNFKRNLGVHATSNSNLVLDVSAADEKEKQDTEDRQLATFSAFQNHYHWGCDLPMTEGVLDVVRRNGRDERVQGDNGANQAGSEDSIRRMRQYSES